MRGSVGEGMAGVGESWEDRSGEVSVGDRDMSGVGECEGGHDW